MNNALPTFHFLFIVLLFLPYLCIHPCHSLHSYPNSRLMFKKPSPTWSTLLASFSNTFLFTTMFCNCFLVTSITQLTLLPQQMKILKQKRVSKINVGPYTQISIFKEAKLIWTKWKFKWKLGSDYFLFLSKSS